MEFNYLVKAANDMFEILSRQTEPTSKDLSQFFAIGCSTLKRLEQDEEFKEVVDHFGSEWKQNQDVVAIIADVRHFTEGFLQIERKVMLAAGLDDCTWSELHCAAEAVRKYVVQTGVNGTRLMTAVMYVREMACDIAADLSNKGVGDVTRRRALNAVGRVAMGVGGAAMIGVNASSLALTIGLSAAGSAVSAAIGGGFITAAMESRNEDK
jgi:hypothetical protein